MTDNEIIDQVNKFLMDEFEVSADIISPDAPLKETLQLDSLDYVDLVVIIEGNFGIKVKQEDFTSIVSFQNLYDYITGKMAQTNLA